MLEPNRSIVTPLLSAVRDLVVIQHRLAGFRYGELNRAGHVLILPLDGRARMELGGRQFDLRRGHAAWVMESEWIRLQVLTAPWSYIQVRFAAPGLTPPPAEHRARRLPRSTQHMVVDLRKAWDERATPLTRRLRVHGLVSALLGHLVASSAADAGPASGEPPNPWWTVESAVRSEISRRFTLRDLVALSGVNRVTLERASRQATGLTPIRRVRQMRLAYAQTLLRDTQLMVKEVAAAVGYPRIHEFSRDYRKAFGSSPRRHRNAAREARPLPAD